MLPSKRFRFSLAVRTHVGRVAYDKTKTITIEAVDIELPDYACQRGVKLRW